MTIPVLILFFTFNTLPMIKGVIYSFTNYRGYGSYDYVGFRNYMDLFTDVRVGKSYLFTFKYALVGTILVNVLSLIMAVGLNSRIRFKSGMIFGRGMALWQMMAISSRNRSILRRCSLQSSWTREQKRDVQRACGDSSCRKIS